MKIVYLHQYFCTPHMNGGVRSYEIARRLVKNGNDVHMITSRRDASAIRANTKWTLTDEAGINVHWIHISYSNSFGFIKRVIAFIRFGFCSATKAIKIDGDIIYATSTPLTIAIPAIIASIVLRKPMVFEVRDLWPDIPIALKILKNPLLIYLAKMLELAAYKHSSHIIALSPGMREGIIKAGISPGKVTVVSNGAELDFFGVPKDTGQHFRKMHPWLRERSLVVYTGTLGKVNGLSYMVDLAEETYSLDREIRFLIVGDGQEKAFVVERARDKGVLDKNLYFFDSVKKNELPSILSAATLSTSFVIDVKELWNNSANKFFDSLASGTPFVINHKGWLADLLIDNNAGIVLDYDDTKSAAKALTDLIYDKKRLSEMENNAKMLAEGDFDYDRLAKNVEQILIRNSRKVLAK